MHEVTITAKQVSDELRRVLGGAVDQRTRGVGVMPAEVVERLESAEANARANAAQVNDRLEKKRELMRVLLLRPLEKGVGRAERLKRLWRLFDTWGESVKPSSACRSGCSDCCSISVGVLRTEAEAISRFTGRPMVEADGPEIGVRLADLFVGRPCTFLKEGKCSIYPVRPLACRGQFNLDSDNLLCRLQEGAEVPVPYADNVQLMTHMVMALGGEVMADIRQWFPPKSGEVAVEFQDANRLRIEGEVP